MDHAEYYRARIPEPTTVLGLTLRPFSLGHLLLLHRIGSFFVGDDENLTYEDLALSVLICSQRYADAVATFDDPQLPLFMQRWAEKLTGKGWMTMLGLRQLRVIPLREKAVEFSRYISSGIRSIDYTTKGEGRPMALPLVQIVRVTLLREFGGLTDEALMDRPWGLCMEDFLTIHAQKENVTIYETGAFEEAEAAAKAHYEKMVERGLIKPPVNGLN